MSEPLTPELPCGRQDDGTCVEHGGRWAAKCDRAARVAPSDGLREAVRTAVSSAYSFGQVNARPALLEPLVDAALAASEAPVGLDARDWTSLPATAQAVIDSWPDEGLIVTREQALTLMQGARMGRAPVGLDVERLARAIMLADITNPHEGIDSTRWHLYAGSVAKALAAEYARLGQEGGTE
jgi:hypothetical protein